jgi:hypothetical protein
MKLTTKLLGSLLLASSFIPAAQAAPTDTLVRWHEIMLQANADDHTPGVGVFEQGGPVRNARAFAMTQLAVYDAVQSFTTLPRRFKQYNAIGDAPAGASMEAAIACAAHGVLVNVYSTFTATFDAALADDLSALGSSPSTTAGCAVGEAAAAAMIARRTGDGSELPDPAPGAGGVTATGTVNWFGEQVNGPESDPNLPRVTFRWSPDPIANQPVALGANWGAVTPFVLTNGAQFRIPAPPTPGSPAYRKGWNEVAHVGQTTLIPSSIPSTSTPAGVFIGNFWGYDGMPLLGTPPRLYAQIAIQVALEKGLTAPAELSRYLAVLHAGMADAGVAAWDSKYFYNYWRPATAIRSDDGVANTPSDPNWTAVGVSVANTSVATHPTPPFPAYPSGHATFGSVMANVMSRQFGGGLNPFTFVSDEYDGVSTDPFTPGVPRPLVPVRFRSYEEASQENGASRILNGVHWQWDNGEGRKLGKNIVGYILGPSGEFKRVR